MTSQTILIIGASAAGVSAAREIRSITTEFSITILTEDEHYPYYRPFLTEYLADKNVENKSNFFLNKNDWYRDQNINLIFGERVIEIDPAVKEVQTESGRRFSYNKLIIASGSSPFVPVENALEKENVFAIRTYSDAKKVYGYSDTIRSAVIIGGGLLGIEAAGSLVTRGIRVSIVELSKRILSLQLDHEGSLFLERILKEKGVELILGEEVKELQGDKKATAVKLGSGRLIETDMVLFSIGVRSNISMVKNSGIAVDRAIVVNDKMETSIPDIYACGDVTQFNGKCVALWMPAVKKGKVAGANAAGGEASFVDEAYPVVLNAFGTRVYSMGQVNYPDDCGELRIHKTINEDTKTYKKIFFHKNTITGFILMNDIVLAQKLATAMKQGLGYDSVLKIVV